MEEQGTPHTNTEENNDSVLHRGFIAVIAVSVVVAGVVGFTAGKLAVQSADSDFSLSVLERERETHNELVASVVERSLPAVVSIVATRDVQVFERCLINPFEDDPFFEFFFDDIRIPADCPRGFEEQEVGGGTGFIISSDGLIVTNRHVVFDDAADYTVITHENKQYSATVLARDPLNDLALLQIEEIGLPTLSLGDSNTVRIGQTAIAIGNALGQFPNTASLGIVSGLSRTVMAHGPGVVEELRNIIQTDAAINQGNSGGPLLNLRGEVIGVNTAVAAHAQGIGFAIPVNNVRRMVESVQQYGRVVYPFLGVRFVTLTEQVAQENNLPVSEGAWIHSDVAAPAVVPGSPADEAGIQPGDIIVSINGEAITHENILLEVLQQYGPEDEIMLEVVRGDEQLSLSAALVEREF